MPLRQLARLVATLDGTRRSPVADAVAARWGYHPGVARHHRSSANHVFALDGAFLRFTPDGYRRRADLAWVARVQSGLDAVAPPVPSLRGRLVETVDVPGHGRVHAMLVRAAPGEQIDVEELTPGRARAWGAGLARLHRDGPSGPGRDWFSELSGPLAARLGTLPRDASRYGFVHGDYELDNLAWVGDRLTAYDLDEAGRSWFVADIAAAVRDLGPGPAFDAFLAGYREVRPLPDGDLSLLPVFVAARAAAWLVRLPAVLDRVESDGPEPDWLVRLRHRLVAHADRQRALVRDSPAEISQVADVSPPRIGSTGAATVN